MFLEISEKDIDLCVKIMQNEDILSFPTETVYGLGVIFDSPKAFEKLCELKRRPPEKPFGMMFSLLDEAAHYIDVEKKGLSLMKAFLPGEITFLVKAKSSLPWHVTLGTGVVGVRIPNKASLLELIKALGKPILQTSANRSGEKTLSSYEDVAKEFGEEIPGIVKGECVSKTPSTIVSLVKDNVELIREGSVPFSEVERIWRSL